MVGKLNVNGGSGSSGDLIGGIMGEEGRKIREECGRVVRVGARELDRGRIVYLLRSYHPSLDSLPPA